MPSPIIIPLLNPNEPDVMLAQLKIADGQRVSMGDVIGTLETTKSAADLTAPQDGYILGLRFQEGQTLRSGETLCFISEDPNWSPPVESSAISAAEPSGLTAHELPPGLRITQPALLLAQQTGLDLKSLPTNQLVTESLVHSIIRPISYPLADQLLENDFDPTAIIVYGAGGHGKSIIELIRTTGTYRIQGVIDDNFTPGQQVLGIPVLGGGELLAELRAKGIRLAANAVGGIGNIQVRVGVFQQLAEAGFVCPALIHPRAFIETSAQVAPGAQILPMAYVGSEAQIGYGCIINTGAIISHDCILGENSNIAPGAVLAGEVQVGPRVLVGMGVTINLRVIIGAGARIGNGSTVKENVPENGIVRAGGVWP